jgi:hypothetical protein
VKQHGRLYCMYIYKAMLQQNIKNTGLNQVPDMIITKGLDRVKTFISVIYVIILYTSARSFAGLAQLDYRRSNGLQVRAIRVRFLVGIREFYFLRNVQTTAGA